MPNRADYTNALIQAVAQRKLAERQPTNQLVDQMALKPRASQSFTRPWPPPPLTDAVDPPFPPQFEPFVPDTLGEMQIDDPYSAARESVSPPKEPAGIAQSVKDAVKSLFDPTRSGGPQTEQEKLIEFILRYSPDTNPQRLADMPIEELREFHRQLVAAGTE